MHKLAILLSASPHVDLFTDADFVSATPHVDKGPSSQTQVRHPFGLIYKNIFFMSKMLKNFYSTVFICKVALYTLIIEFIVSNSTTLVWNLGRIIMWYGSSCQFLFLILEFSVVSINQLKSQLFEMVFSSFDTVNFQ